MKKLDLKKSLDQLYTSSTRTINLVTVPAMQFLMIDGTGDPNFSQAYKAAVEALFSASYTLKFNTKKSKATDYTVMPLETLWRVENPDDKTGWRWTAMIAQPDFIENDMFQAARAQVGKRKDSSVLGQMRLERFTEGLTAQTLHIGPYAEETATIRRIAVFMREHDLEKSGPHHEIYLSDPRRSAPEKLKTILRQPVRAIGSPAK